MFRINIDVPGVEEVYLIKRKGAKRVSLSFEGEGTLRVSVPYFLSYKDAEGLLKKNRLWVDKYVKKMQRVKKQHEALLKENKAYPGYKAKDVLAARLKELADVTGLSYNGIRIREFKTRWGSCAGENIINLNSKLVNLPGRLRDYVIVHELIHTRIKNHRREFWDELEKYLPEGRSLDKELKAYYPQFL